MASKNELNQLEITKIILPLLFTILISFVCFNENRVLPKIPFIFSRIFMKNKVSKSYQNLLPEMPLNNSCIFKLGQLEKQLSDIEEKYRSNKQEFENKVDIIIQKAKQYVSSRGEMFQKYFISMLKF